MNEAKQWKQTASGNQGVPQGSIPGPIIIHLTDERKTPGCSPKWPILLEGLPTPGLLFNAEVKLLELLNLQEF